MDYIVTDFYNHEHKMSYSYNSLRDDYNTIKSYTDEEFLANLPDILHTTVFICWIKEVPSEHCLSDYGVIHELVHLLSKTESPFNPIDKVRDMWCNVCRL